MLPKHRNASIRRMSQCNRRYKRRSRLAELAAITAQLMLDSACYQLPASPVVDETTANDARLDVVWRQCRLDAAAVTDDATLRRNFRRRTLPLLLTC